MFGGVDEELAGAAEDEVDQFGRDPGWRRVGADLDGDLVPGGDLFSQPLEGGRQTELADERWAELEEESTGLLERAFDLGGGELEGGVGGAGA